jgi:hypothetical protein
MWALMDWVRGRWLSAFTCVLFRKCGCAGRRCCHWAVFISSFLRRMCTHGFGLLLFRLRERDVCNMLLSHISVHLLSGFMIPHPR